MPNFGSELLALPCPIFSMPTCPGVSIYMRLTRSTGIVERHARAVTASRLEIHVRVGVQAWVQIQEPERDCILLIVLLYHICATT